MTRDHTAAYRALEAAGDACTEAADCAAANLTISAARAIGLAKSRIREAEMALEVINLNRA